MKVHEKPDSEGTHITLGTQTPIQIHHHRCGLATQSKVKVFFHIFVTLAVSVEPEGVPIGFRGYCQHYGSLDVTVIGDDREAINVVHLPLKTNFPLVGMSSR